MSLTERVAAAQGIPTGAASVELEVLGDSVNIGVVLAVKHLHRSRVLGDKVVCLPCSSV